MTRRMKQRTTDKGFGLSLTDHIQDEGSVHCEAVRAVEELTNRNVICYRAFLR